MSSATPQYRKDIDGLRTIAVLAVVFFHAFPEFIKGGFVGVDVFFVISGFLISTIIFTKLEKQTFSFLDFYWRRVKRIFPALLLILIVSYVTGWFVLLPDEFKQLGRHMASGATFTSNFTLWNESGYFDTASEGKPLLHLWSLAIEEQYYIVWPLLMFWAFRKNIKLFKVCLAFFIASLAFSVGIQKSYPEMNFYSPFSRFWEIASGAILAYMTMKGKTIVSNDLNGRINTLKSVLGLGLILTAVFTFSKNTTFPGAWALLPTLGACLLISAGPNSFINKFFLSHPVMVWIGMISYPLYLWHWPLLSFGNILNRGPLEPAMASVAVVASLVLAWLTYKIIETPIRFHDYSRKVFISLCAVMVALWGVGRITYKNQGFVFRLPESLRKYAVIEFDWNAKVRHGSCHIQEYTESTHPALCIENKRPSVMLWGDSHASSLYPGLKALQEKHGFGITQLTKAGCGPLLNYVNSKVPGCADANSKDLQIAIDTQPDFIVLDAYWPHIDDLHTDQVLEHLIATVQILHEKVPQAKVFVVGPVPSWKDTLQKAMISYSLHHGTQTPPQYMKYDLLPASGNLDKIMQERLGKVGVSYISAYQILCTEEGCLTATGPDPTDLTAMDYGHLSAAGSKYLMERVFEKMK